LKEGKSQTLKTTTFYVSNDMKCLGYHNLLS